jgi:hypothetical protein
VYEVSPSYPDSFAVELFVPVTVLVANPVVALQPAVLVDPQMFVAVPVYSLNQPLKCGTPPDVVTVLVPDAVTVVLPPR